MDNERYANLFLVCALIIIAQHIPEPVSIGLSIICLGFVAFAKFMGGRK